VNSVLATKKVRLIMELRAFGITDARVLGAIERVPRERFFPTRFATAPTRMSRCRSDTVRPSASRWWSRT
jgi:protein-L-isoaspartate O-methyltransferase